MRIAKLGKISTGMKILLIGNICLWIYFCAAFAHASYPFQPDPLGDPAGTGYTFWGHSIAIVESEFIYPFYRVVYYAEFPSFALAQLIIWTISPNLVLYGFWGGISLGGWLLLGVMVISFFQWYVVGMAAHRLWQKLKCRDTLRNS
jgi:hypothetical protein